MKSYPVPRPELRNAADDRRFTVGLIHEVAKAIESRGYPVLETLDLVELQQALFRFLYLPEGRA